MLAPPPRGAALLTLTSTSVRFAPLGSLLGPRRAFQSGGKGLCCLISYVSVNAPCGATPLPPLCVCQPLPPSLAPHLFDSLSKSLICLTCPENPQFRGAAARRRSGYHGVRGNHVLGRRRSSSAAPVAVANHRCYPCSADSLSGADVGGAKRLRSRPALAELELTALVSVSCCAASSLL